MWYRASIKQHSYQSNGCRGRKECEAHGTFLIILYDAVSGGNRDFEEWYKNFEKQATGGKKLLISDEIQIAVRQR